MDQRITGVYADTVEVSRDIRIKLMSLCIKLTLKKLSQKPNDYKEKLDLRIGEPMQICIHRKDNSPKPVNHRLTLKERPTVKCENIRRFPAYDLL